MMTNFGEMETCLLRMKAFYASLRPSEQKVADYILEHPEEVIHLSVTELSNRTGVSDAAIIKFCQRIGYKGYQELKIYLAKELVSPMMEIYGEVAPDDDIKTVKEKIFQINSQALQDTRKLLDDEGLEQAVKAIAEASKVNIYGVGASGFVALDAQLKLLRIGIQATSFCDSHVQTYLAALLSSGDVAIAISDSGNTKDVVRALSVAKERGARTVCITSSPDSAIGKVADIKLYTAATESIFRSGAIASRLAQLSVIDVLFIGVALKRYDCSLENLARTREAAADLKY